MIENGLYIIKTEYFLKFKKLGCCFKDCKEETRPVFCCIKDVVVENLYWAIPVSEITQDKINNGALKRVQKFLDYKNGSLGWAYYHIHKTNKDSIYNISSAFPITTDYIEREWILNDEHFIVPHTSNIDIIRTKLRRILNEERLYPNKFEQHITDIKNSLIKELEDLHISELKEIETLTTPE